MTSTTTTKPTFSLLVIFSSPADSDAYYLGTGSVLAEFLLEKIMC